MISKEFRDHVVKLDEIVRVAREVEGLSIILRTEAWPAGDLFLHGSRVLGRTIPAGTLRRVNHAMDELRQALADLDNQGE